MKVILPSTFKVGVSNFFNHGMVLSGTCLPKKKLIIPSGIIEIE